MTLLEEAKIKLGQIIEDNSFTSNEKIEVIAARHLTPEEAIGNPERTDYHLYTGKEFMLEARFRNGIGQAFTDQPGNFQGTLDKVLKLPLDINYHRAVFVAALNAVLHNMEKIEGTIHCKDKELALCAKALPGYIRKQFGNPKIAFIGLQPAMVQALCEASFDIRVSDLNPDNIGQYCCGIKNYAAKFNAENARLGRYNTFDRKCSG